ncbi:predicted protein, partial [Postia placenta Mad-698-R]
MCASGTHTLTSKAHSRMCASRKHNLMGKAHSRMCASRKHNLTGKAHVQRWPIPCESTSICAPMVSAPCVRPGSTPPRARLMKHTPTSKAHEAHPHEQGSGSTTSRARLMQVESSGQCRMCASGTHTLTSKAH